MQRRNSIQKQSRSWLCLVGLASVVHGTNAMAYNETTHQDLVDFAWEVMLASQDPALHSGRSLFPGIPVPPQSLRKVAGTQYEYDQFLERIRRAILNINQFQQGIPSAPYAVGDTSACGDLSKLGRQTPMGLAGKARPGADYSSGSGSDRVFPGDSHGDLRCDQKVSAGSRRRGIFSAIGGGERVGLGGIFGDTESQGLILGWHAKAADDAKKDWVIRSNIAGAILDIVVPTDLAIGAVVLVGACVGELFGFGDYCSISDAKRAADQVDPFGAALDAIPDEWTVGFGIDGGSYIGLGHFIDARAGAEVESEWDDRSGMWYDNAHSEPGFADDFIITLGDIAEMQVIPDESLGVEQYDLGRSADDSHPTKRTRRTDWQWGRDTVGHTQHTPLDNLAYHGWNEFKKTSPRNAAYLRWPLHALGDATVPMHIVLTSSYGHSAYEGAVARNWKAIRYLYDTNTANSQLAQFEQARRILSIAHGANLYIQQYRGSGVGDDPFDVPIRDLVTVLAKHALSTLKQSQQGGDWAWCDLCSLKDVPRLYGPPIVDGQPVDIGAESIEGYYDDYVVEMRSLAELSAGYILGFMVAAAEGEFEPACANANEFANGRRCCSDEPPEANGRCPLKQVECFACGTCRSKSDCLGSANCINGYCESGDECNDSSACNGRICRNGRCTAAGECSSDLDCRSVGLVCGGTPKFCCAKEGVGCASTEDCCRGLNLRCLEQSGGSVCGIIVD
jgi:hypothetical protein